MSLRRKLLILVAAAFLGTCAILYQGSPSDDVENWVSLDSVEPISLAQLQREGWRGQVWPVHGSVKEAPADRQAAPGRPLPLDRERDKVGVSSGPPQEIRQQVPAIQSLDLAAPRSQPGQTVLPADEADTRLMSTRAMTGSSVASSSIVATQPKPSSLPKTESDFKPIGDLVPAEPSQLHLTTQPPMSAESQASANSVAVAPTAVAATPVAPTSVAPQAPRRQPISIQSTNQVLVTQPVSDANSVATIPDGNPIPDASATSLRSDGDFIPLKNSGAGSDSSRHRPNRANGNSILQVERPNQAADRAVDNPKNHLATHLVPAAETGGLKQTAQLPQPGLPAVLQNAQNFVLAEQPKMGASWNHEGPLTDACAVPIAPLTDDFSPGPASDCDYFDPDAQRKIYEGKTLNANQRPLLEIGRPWYQLGQLSPPSTRFGKHNPIEHQFIVFGDARSGVASNTQAGNTSTLTASQLNLNFDWKVTSTERLHLFVSPLTQGLDSTGFLFDEDRFLDNTNFDIPFGFLEGDLGAIVGGMTNQTYPFDLPFAVGVIPMVFQNGVWMEDPILGFAFTIPSRNSARLDISNMDVTFFAGFDKVVTDALPGDDSAGKVYGMASFIEAWNGYVEADYAFIEDRTLLDRSYHNLGLGYTRRFGRFVSNSTRAIVNLGQAPDGIAQTADGWLLLSENSLITGAPSTVVPYFNLFAGFDRPQSVARNALAGGVLRNTGILFESDNLTRYPTLDSTANDTYGAALGLNLLASDFSQQLVLETAFLGTMGPDAGRNALGNQYGMGARYQLPLTNSLIFRADLMYGFLESTEDSHGARVELRHKF